MIDKNKAHIEFMRGAASHYCVEGPPDDQKGFAIALGEAFDAGFGILEPEVTSLEAKVAELDECLRAACLGLVRVGQRETLDEVQRISKEHRR